MHTSGFSVNNQDRNDVLAFWHAVYQASEGYQNRIAWTGNYSGNNGTISAAFVDDVERRVNYFRAMAGVPANVQLDSDSTVRVLTSDAHKPPTSTLKFTAAQHAALMLIRNYNSSNGSNPAFSHNPPSGITGFSAEAWNANSKSNLAFGNYGPGAITAYMQEELPTSSSSSSNWNSAVGHRRWILHPPAANFATGDQPGESVSRPPTNVLYISQRNAEAVTGLPPGFVTYPSAGFFPAPINTRFWSVSYPGADFTNATASVTQTNGSPVSVNAVIKSSSYGDPAIILDLLGTADMKSVQTDTTFNVTISGIAGAGVPASHSYSVTLINPDLLDSNQSLVGAAAPPPLSSASYFFTPPPGCEETAITSFQPLSTPWTEGAENGPPAPRIIDNTHENYDLIAVTNWFAGGSKAFRLSFPVLYDAVVRGVPEQSFEVDRDIIPNAGATLNFKFRRGYFTPSSKMVVETSTTDGATWAPLGGVISGVSESNVDGSVTTASRTLPVGSAPVRVRFRIYHNGGSMYISSQGSAGIYINDITTTNCDWLEKKASTILPGSADRFTLDSTSAGIPLAANLALNLRLRTKLGGKWFHHGPVKPLVVTALPLTGYTGWNTYQFPVLNTGFTGDMDGDGLKNGIEYAFSLDPLKSSSPDQFLSRNSVAGTLALSVALPEVRSDIDYRAEWSGDLTNWSESGVIVSTLGGQAVAIAPLGSGARFMRWKIAEP